MVNIIEPPSQLVAERRYEIVCESIGSRPNAIITWYKGKRQLRRTKVSAARKLNCMHHVTVTDMWMEENSNI